MRDVPTAGLPPAIVPLQRWRWYAALAAILAGMLSLMFYAHSTGHRMVAFQGPLVDAAKQIQLETITGHLWFEEVLYGERPEPLDPVWDYFHQALAYAEAMLEGGESPKGPIQKIDDPRLRQEVAALRAAFGELRALAEERYATERAPSPRGGAHERYHAVFHQLMHAAGNLESSLDQTIEGELRRFRILHLLLIGLGLGGAGLVGWVFCYFERRVRRDFSELVEKSSLVSRSEARFRTLLEHVTDPLYVCDLEGRIVDCNRRACEALGYTREELLALAVPEIEVGHLPEEIRRVKANLAPGLPTTIEGVHRRKDGSTFPVEVSLQRFALGGRDLVIGIARDLTERKRAEEALRESEQWYQGLAEVSPVGIFRADAAGSCVYVNARWSTIAGLSPAEARGEGWSRALHPDDRERVVAEWQASARTGRPFRLEYRFRTPAGATTWVIGSATAVKGNGGENLGYVGTVTDITHRKLMEEELREARDELEARVRERTAELEKANRRLQAEVGERLRAEEELRYSEKKYGTLVESSPTGIFIFREDRFAFVNRRFAEMAGYSPRELLEMDPFQLLCPEDRARMADIAGRRLAGEDVPADYEVRFVRRDGQTRWVNIRSALIEYRGGVSTLGNVQDITGQRAAATALRQSQEALRRLSNRLMTAQEEERARIAREIHDSIGQALSAIKFHVEHALAGCENLGSPPLARSLRDVVARVQETVEEVRRISMALRPSLLDDLGLVATVGWQCREFRAANPTMAVECDLEVEEQDVPERLKIVLFRIIQEAMGNAGRHSGGDAVQVTLRRLGQMLELSVGDNGRGLDLASLDERTAEDVGYGLSSMRERAEASGGKLTVELPDAGGTTIRGTWPLGGEAIS